MMPGVAPSPEDVFPRAAHAPEGRTFLQLTEGEAFCYPLYYFIPSITADGRWMVYHRETPGDLHEIQMHRLDLATGESARLTACTARGVSGDRGALAPKRGVLVYLEGNRFRAVDVAAAEQREFFEVPGDRFVLSQNCFTGDEAWFVYVDVDRDAFFSWLERGRDREEAGMCKGTAVRAFHMDTGEHRTLFYINYPVHHVHPVGDRGIAFSHVPGDLIGMGVASVDRPGYCIPRPRDERNARIIHHVATARGIAYELSPAEGERGAGILNPDTGERLEFPVPGDVNHTGLDPAGGLFFYQRGRDRVQAIRRFDPGGDHEWTDLTGSWRTFGRGQKAHFHPRLVCGGRWMQFVAGDPRTGTNHVFLADVSDLGPTEGVPWPPDGSTGEI